MHGKYSPEQKAAALARLAQNRGNVALTAHQTGISPRTIYYWRNEQWLLQTLQQSPHPPLQTLHFDDDLSALSHLRTQILDSLLSSSGDFGDSLTFMSPYQRAQIAIMLLDRLMKLNEHLKPYRSKSPTTYHVIDSEGEEPDGDEPDLAEGTSQTEGDSQL